ncbi:MAG: hypothetical protein J6Q15_03460 [Clostridia bacterium]|nr:hypothetical protein [Clostridia bacterium]
MEKNNFNKAYIYIIAIFAIGIAISNVISFFHGVGFALIGASLCLILAIINILKDDANKKRFGDLFILIILEFLMLIVLFFAYDFNLNGITNKFPIVMRNICAIYSMIATGYVIFRYISEIKGKKYDFVEYILGNYTPDPTDKKKSKEKIKKNKELENGTLEPKPSSLERVEEEQHSIQSTCKIAVEDQSVKQETDLSIENADKEDVIELEDDEMSEDKKQDNFTETKVDNEATSNSTVTNRTKFWY